MKSIPLILNKLYREPWAILPSQHDAICASLERHLAGVEAPDLDDLELESTTSSERIDGAAVVDVFGIIGKHLSLLETACGGVDVDAVGAAVDEAAADEGVGSIVLNINSPGGTITGVPELAAKIRAARENKMVVAYTDDMMASAAYWLASQADYIYASTSAEVGSIGVYVALMDESERLEKEGVKVNTISAGEFKLAGASFKALTDDERAMFQADVDKWFAMFKSDILKNRKIDDKDMQGQTFDGADATRAGLVDGIVDDLAGVLRLTTRKG